MNTSPVYLNPRFGSFIPESVNSTGRRASPIMIDCSFISAEERHESKHFNIIRAPIECQAIRAERVSLDNNQPCAAMFSHVTMIPMLESRLGCQSPVMKSLILPPTDDKAHGTSLQHLHSSLLVGLSTHRCRLHVFQETGLGLLVQRPANPVGHRQILGIKYPLIVRPDGSEESGGLIQKAAVILLNLITYYPYLLRYASA
ncbi:hypothetical protein GGR53DRAFT_110078 [Hypoxylon sp. FL1150]|nr:hypothetical protein GGR53DRAFT_110078 [Hypoxylon sp. FL1150]